MSHAVGSCGHVHCVVMCRTITRCLAGHAPGCQSQAPCAGVYLDVYTEGPSQAGVQLCTLAPPVTGPGGEFTLDRPRHWFPPVCFRRRSNTVRRFIRPALRTCCKYASGLPIDATFKKRCGALARGCWHRAGATHQPLLLQDVRRVSPPPLAVLVADFRLCAQIRP